MFAKQPKLKAPFPWFGGKSRVAHIVWDRFGNVPNYVEPFFGSGAVLLGRPHKPKTETINDKDGFVVNFWRAVKHDPEAVAKWADNPVFECDLHARHAWLVGIRDTFVPRLEGDPEFYDAKVAGWWCWGLCCWIGSEWCNGKGPWNVQDGQLVHLSGRQGIKRQLVHLSGDRGVNCGGTLAWLGRLQERLEDVTIACGDWSRVVTDTPTIHNGLTGLFLDPPYLSGDKGHELYRADDTGVANDVRQWCIENGDNEDLRIALCGYEGEHAMPDDWEVVEWSASGGYGNQGSHDNRHRERIWFSPHCLKPDGMLFS